jgi:hypothetical protein
MPLWLQHLLVVALVGFALFVVIRQVVGTLRLRHAKAGSCCAQGCGSAAGAAGAQAKPDSQRIVFLPVESLTRSRERS